MFPLGLEVPCKSTKARLCNEKSVKNDHHLLGLIPKLDPAGCEGVKNDSTKLNISIQF